MLNGHLITIPSLLLPQTAPNSPCKIPLVGAADLRNLQMSVTRTKQTVDQLDKAAPMAIVCTVDVSNAGHSLRQNDKY